MLGLFVTFHPHSSCFSFARQDHVIFTISTNITYTTGKGSLDSQTATALTLPLLTYKVAATLRGQRIQWYLDAAIALAIKAFLSALQR